MAPKSGLFLSLSSHHVTLSTQHSYQNGRYLFHVSTVRLLTLICVTEDTFERGVAYCFLSRVYDELSSAGLLVIQMTSLSIHITVCLPQEKANTCGPYAIRTEFGPKLGELMREFSSADKVTVLQSQVLLLPSVLLHTV